MKKEITMSSNLPWAGRIRAKIFGVGDSHYTPSGVPTTCWYSLKGDDKKTDTQIIEAMAKRINFKLSTHTGVDFFTSDGQTKLAHLDRNRILTFS